MLCSISGQGIEMRSFIVDPNLIIDPFSEFVVQNIYDQILNQDISSWANLDFIRSLNNFKPSSEASEDSLTAALDKLSNQMEALY